MADDPTEDAIETAIVNNATGPKSVTVGGESATSQPIADQIAAANFVAAKVAAQNPSRGVRFTRLVPPGCG